MLFLEEVGDGRRGLGSLQFAEETKKIKRRDKRLMRTLEDRELFISETEKRVRVK